MSSKPTKRRQFLRYGLAVVLVGAAYVVRMFLEPIAGAGAPFVLFFGALGAASLLAGPGPGLLATLLSIPLAAHGFVAPRGTSESQLFTQATLFAADGLLIVYLSVAVARARRVAETSEAHQRELIELAPDPFFLADLDGRFTDVNESACRMLGYEREELVGKTIADLIPAEDLPRLAADRAVLLVPGQVRRGEWRHRRKDGTLVPTEVSAKILPGGRWQAFTRDISERKRLAEEQRFLAEAGAALGASLDYEETLSTLGHLVVRDFADWCVIDLIEDQSHPRRHKVISRSASHAQLASELEQLPLDRRLAHLAGPVLETRRSYLVERVTPEKLESFAQNDVHLRILRDIDPQSILGLPLLVRAELRGVLILMSSRLSRTYGLQDLRTGEALAERAALAIENGRLYEMAKHATRLRDEVLGVVAHDLRNPVAAITLTATALRRRGPEGERRNLKPVDSIIRAAGRMNRLIGDLLDVSLIEAGQLRVESARVCTRQLLADSIDAQRPMVASAALELEVEVPDDLPDVWGDQHRLLQVLENLVGNAIKFTPAEGHITVGAAPREGEVLFWVADTGSGISADGLAHVFDPFWQARRGTRQGAGLGLPITRGIIEAHGGRIWVESTLGRGSVFCFTVPLAHPQPPAEVQAADTLH